MTRDIRHAGTPDLPPGDGTWSWDAACANDPDLMYPEYAGDAAKAAWVRPRQICKRCPVVVPCLKTAMFEEATGAERHGMRGGLTPEERAALVQKAKPKAKPGPVAVPAGMPTSKPCSGKCGKQVGWAMGRKPDGDWWCGDEPCMRRQDQVAKARLRASQTGRTLIDSLPPASKLCACGCGETLPWKHGRKAKGPWWGETVECQRKRARLSEERRRAAARELAA